MKHCSYEKLRANHKLWHSIVERNGAHPANANMQNGPKYCSTVLTITLTI